MGERQTAEVRFLITRVSLRVLAIAAVHRSLLPSLPPSSWPDNFSPPSFLTDRDSNRIHKIGPLRITPPLLSRFSALVFQRASDCTHGLKHTEAERVTKQDKERQREADMRT